MNIKVKNIIGLAIAFVLVSVFVLTGCCVDSLIDNGHWLVAFSGIFMPYVIGWLVYKHTTFFDGLVDE